MAESRLEHLREMVVGAEERMLSKGCTDQNYAVLGRFRRECLAEIDVLDPPTEQNRPKSGLTEFERRLAEREQSTASTSRRAASK
jgi:hypothetical protein